MICCEKRHIFSLAHTPPRRSRKSLKPRQWMAWSFRSLRNFIRNLLKHETCRTMKQEAQRKEEASLRCHERVSCGSLRSATTVEPPMTATTWAGANLREQRISPTLLLCTTFPLYTGTQARWTPKSGDVKSAQKSTLSQQLDISYPKISAKPRLIQRTCSGRSG